MKSYAKYSGTPAGDRIIQTPPTLTKTCGCGGNGCAACSNQSYVRPRFFAGQLLTEEDLQSLSDYVVAKNRLHNRHFFGEGVVCGLDVTCHPCGGGKVIVAPGYALDCCGNDIVLTCPTELDINAMVRELRINTLGGYDCGDPCAEKKMEDCEDGKKGEKDDHQKSVRRYRLYVRYCEELTDPVTPYGPDEPCVQPGCEPTRVREGVRFELRCPDEETASDDLLVRLRRCFGDLLGAETISVEAGWHQTFGRRIAAAQPSTVPHAPTNEEFQEATKQLKEALEKFPPEGEGGEEKPVTQDDLFNSLEATLNLTSLFARGILSGGGREQEFKAVMMSLDTEDNTRGNAIAALKEASEVVTQDRINAILPNTLDRVYASAIFDGVNQVVEVYARFLSIFSDEADSNSAEQLKSVNWIALQYLAYRVPLNSELLNKALFSLSALREWLLCRLDTATCFTDCTLRQDILCINLSAGNSNDLSRSATTYSKASLRLIEALFRYLRECLCCVLNPPCPPCEDTAVLLAGLEVTDCKVVKICNLERTFVLTPIAARYWLPPLNLLGDAIEKLCCKPIHLNFGGESVEDSGYGPRTYPAQQNLLGNVPANLLTNLFGLSKKDARRLVNVLVALWSLIRADKEHGTFLTRNLQEWADKQTRVIAQRVMREGGTP